MNIPRFDGHKGEQGHRPMENHFSEKRKAYLTLKKVLLSAISLCLLIALETTVFSALPFPFLGDGGRGAPALCCLFFLSVACAMGEKEGCVAGCMAGFAYECLFGSGYFFLALFYGILGYVAGLLSKRILAQNMPSYLVFAAVGCVIECFRAFISACLKAGELVSYTYWLYALLPRFVWSMVFAIGVYDAVCGLRRLVT